MKTRTVVLGSAVIIAIMLLVSPSRAQATPQPMNLEPPAVDRLAVHQPPTLTTTTQLTVTPPGQFDRNSEVTAPTGGGGISPYRLTWQRLTDNDRVDLEPVVAFNAKRDEYLVVWTQCNGPCGIVGQRTSRQGMPIGGLLTISTGHHDRYPAIAYNSYHGEYLVVYVREGPTDKDLYGRIILGNGMLYGSELTIDAAPGHQSAASIAFNPTAINNFHPGEYFVVYQYGTHLESKHVGSYGNVDASSAPLELFGVHITPDVEYNPARDEYLLVYTEVVSDTPPIHNRDIRARRLSAEGAPQASTIDVDDSAGQDTVSPQVAVGDDMYYVIYVSGPSTSSGDVSIVGAWVTGDGHLAFLPVVVAKPPPDGPGSPRVAYTGNGFLATWGGQAGTNLSNLYGRYIRPTSVFPLFWSDVFMIDTSEYDQLNGAVACTTGSCLIVDSDEWYESEHDFEITAWSIWLQKVFLPLVLK